MTVDPAPSPLALGARNAAWMALPVGALLLVATGALAGLTDLAWRDALDVALLACMGLSLVGGGVIAASQARARGSLVEDLGPHPMRWFFLGCAGFFFLGGQAMIAGSQIFGDGASLGDVGIVLMGTFALALSFGRLQLTSKGVWGFWGLLRWDQMAGFRWTSRGMLLIEARSAFPFPMPRTGGIPVPERHRATLDETLRRNGVRELDGGAPLG